VNGGQVARQSSSYRQGLVLGLTMAEIMLLLVFCLLIATGALLARERRNADEAVARLATASASAKANQDFVDRLKRDPALAEAMGNPAGASDPTAIDEFWRKLVEGAQALDALERHGLARSSVEASAEHLAKAEAFRRKGGDLDTVVTRAAVVDAIERAVGGAPLDAGDPDALAELLRKGSTAAAREAAAAAERAAAERSIGELRAALIKAADEARVTAEVAAKAPGHDWPPIIKLSEAGGYFFKTGRAELEAEFERQLRVAIVPRLLEIARQYGVDVIEVVGHTDEQPMGGQGTNLDRDLAAVLRGSAPVGALRPGDNAGLGLARAVAVVSILLRDERLSGLRLLPLSGAQLIQTDERLSQGTMSGDVKERRRIEIRVRKSSPE
jgi:flagellar motor protein MotB